MSDSEFLSEQALSDRIRLVCNEVKVDCAVAFWGQDTGKPLFPHWGEGAVRIVCDISMGCNSQTSLVALGAPNNANLRVLDKLHAKVFWSQAGAVVSSANASRNGIGAASGAAVTVEAGVFFAPQTAGWKAAGQFVQDCFDRSLPLDNSQLDRAPARATDPVPHIGPQGLNAPSVFKRVLASPEQFKGTLFVITGANLSDEDEKRSNRQHDEAIRLKHFEPAKRTLVFRDDPDVLSKPKERVLMFWFGDQKPKVWGYVSGIAVPATDPEAVFGTLNWPGFWKQIGLTAPTQRDVLANDETWARRLCPSADADPDGWCGTAYELASALTDIGFRPDG